MANVNAPRGAVPFQRFGAAGFRNSLSLYFVPAANTNALAVGDFVTKKTGAADTAGVPGIDRTVAGANPITGVICAFIGSCAAGAGVAKASFWPLGTVGGVLTRPATTALDFYALVSDDPAQEYVMQENDNSGGVAGTPLPLTAVGKNAAFIYAAANVYGVSGTMLDANVVNTTASTQLSIKGFVVAVDNAPAALFSKVIVTINNHTEAPNVAGI